MKIGHIVTGLSLGFSVLSSAYAVTGPGSCGANYFQQFVARDNWGNINFSMSCQGHDICYETCGAFKKTCDTDFKHAMKTECKTLENNSMFNVERKLCRELANLYYSAVDRLGGEAFNTAQKHCQV